MQWLLNRYPGCACGMIHHAVAGILAEVLADIPSHAYTYNFALNVGQIQTTVDL